MPPNRKTNGDLRSHITVEMPTLEKNSSGDTDEVTHNLSRSPSLTFCTRMLSVNRNDAGDDNRPGESSVQRFESPRNMDQRVKEDNDECEGATGWTRDNFSHEDQNAALLMNVWRHNTRLHQEQLRAEEIARR